MRVPAAGPSTARAAAPRAARPAARAGAANTRATRTAARAATSSTTIASVRRRRCRPDRHQGHRVCPDWAAARWPTPAAGSGRRRAASPRTAATGGAATALQCAGPSSRTARTPRTGYAPAGRRRHRLRPHRRRRLYRRARRATMTIRIAGSSSAARRRASFATSARARSLPCASRRRPKAMHATWKDGSARRRGCPRQCRCRRLRLRLCTRRRRLARTYARGPMSHASSSSAA